MAKMILKHMKAFHKILPLQFEHFGVFIGRYAVSVLIVMSLIVVLFAQSITKLKSLDDPEYLYVPKNGPAQSERMIVEKYYSNNTSLDFNRGESLHDVTGAKFIITAKDGGNVLEPEYWKYIEELDKATVNFVVDDGDSKITYEDVCLKENEGDTCAPNSVVGFAGQFFDDAESIPALFKMNPFQFDKEQRKQIHMVLTVTVDKTFNITSAKALALYYNLINRDEKM